MQVLCQLDKFYGKDNEFWQQLKDHSSYDDFWQKTWNSTTFKRYQTCCNEWGLV
jgi:hypothetical protein